MNDYVGEAYGPDWDDREDDEFVDDVEGEGDIMAWLHRAGYAFQTAVCDLTDTAMHWVGTSGSARLSAMCRRYKQRWHGNPHLADMLSSGRRRWHRTLHSRGFGSTVRSRRTSVRRGTVKCRRKRRRKRFTGRSRRR